ncbi:uncharacterized protein [Palaemon carinicauda]|uniref:uncharacterized protein n=1 Tax=Palaemon carinicauda TaxID=392227 RepID=UPI0035B66D62
MERQGTKTVAPPQRTTVPPEPWDWRYFSSRFPERSSRKEEGLTHVAGKFQFLLQLHPPEEGGLVASQSDASALFGRSQPISLTFTVNYNKVSRRLKPGDSQQLCGTE